VPNRATKARLVAIGATCGAVEILDDWMISLLPQHSRPWPPELVNALLPQLAPTPAGLGRDLARPPGPGPLFEPGTGPGRAQVVSGPWVHRYAAEAIPSALDGRPWALYGRWPLDAQQQALWDAFAKLPTLQVFVPEVPDDPWLAWARTSGSPVRRLPGDSVVSELTGTVLEPRCWEDWLSGDARHHVAVLAADAAEARLLHLKLASRGLATGPSDSHGSFPVAWEAGDPDASPDAVLLWLASQPDLNKAALREAVARAGHRRQTWPLAVRAAWDRLREARQQVLLAPTWRDLGSALARWAAVAGLDLGVPVHGWDLWDQADLPVSPDAVIAWAGRWEGDLPDTAPAILTPPDLAGAVYEQLVVTEAAWLDRLSPTELWLVHRSARAFGVGVGFRVGIDPVSPPAAWERGRFDPGHVRPPAAVTGFEQYGRCPLQYAWRALGVEPLPVEGPEPEPSLIGRWAHRALEVLLGSAGAAEEAARRVEAAVAMAVSEMPPPPSVLPESLAATVESLATDLVWLLLTEPPQGEVECEVEFQLKTETGIRVTGRLDRVERMGPRARAVDYKTGRLPTGGRPAPSALQLPLYAQAVRERYGLDWEAVEAAYWGVRRGTGFARRELTPPLERRWQETVAILDGIQKRARAGWFLPFPEAGTCRTCDYRLACPPDAAQSRRTVRVREPRFAILWAPSEEDDDGAHG
jgi:RecB family exonuclease